MKLLNHVIHGRVMGEKPEITAGKFGFAKLFCFCLTCGGEIYGNLLCMLIRGDNWVLLAHRP